VAFGTASSRRRFVLKSALAATIGLALTLLAAPAALAQPANDDFANATVIDASALPFTDITDTAGATSEAGEPQAFCSYYTDGTVWYAFTPSSDGVFQVDTSASSYDNAIHIYSGSSLPALTFIACGYSFNPPTFHATAGTTYYIQVAGSTSLGTLHLTLSQVSPPPNDDFANATPISSLPFSDTVDHTAATTQPSEPSPSCVELQNTVWYAFTPTTTQHVTARTDEYGPGLGVYTGSSLANLTEIGCSQSPYLQPLVFRAEANTTYYIQLGGWCCAGFGQVTFHLEVAPDPVAQFLYYLPGPVFGDPSVYDTVQFQDYSNDPAGAGIASQAWSFGDGATATGCCPTHQYTQDGDYTVGLTVTTPDGRTASTSQVVQVRTHDVAIVRIGVPNSAHVGQTIAVNVDARNTRYPETVQVDLFKAVPGGFQQVGSITQSVPVRSGNRTTRFPFTYLITEADRSIGKVSLRAVATIIDHRDALPADNELISPPVKIT
jgi:PKD domain